MTAASVTVACKMSSYTERFLDLLEPVRDDDRDSDIDLEPHRAFPGLSGFAPSDRQESCHGTMKWNTRLSAELQKVVDSMCLQELYELDFSVTVADPSQADCPLVACSVGFTQLTGYSVQEIVGRNCRFLLDGVPANLVDEETRIRCRAFCQAASEGVDFTDESEYLPAGLQKPWVELSRGELICVQTNARKTGELFRNMFYLKQVELDEQQFIVGLQAGLPEDFDVDGGLVDLEKRCSMAFSRLEANMSAIEQVLASQFWYSAPMRRQISP
mmetsp:Transcript_3244/g.7207  ORF Transcript_3244/g.7207 Transcript_3244/m.7207 type:complete len:272 (-) Transcript_3244:171-986(-)|eukprot:CAMPEP_0178405168 /NCGR_PEP_ID=MMETSP0689_2-20121128/18261_1 /TAXON_ID=160604 /ORGANISM="Amphidinium massartii, Strain CS-259" /LENGTH=271 /DNA_ID=CAMNT_0020026177 /DNA_START=81 /DNA_END=896 /DNA_ORIENTATION=+